MAKTKEEFVASGRRWGSDLVIKEAEAAIERWRQDLSLLTKWGFGKAKLESLESMLAQLKERHRIYKTEVGAKLAATPEEANANEELRDWSKQALGVLDDLIQTDIKVEASIQALGGNIPTDSQRLLTMAQGIHKIAFADRARLDPEAADDEFYNNGTKLIELLGNATKQKNARRESKEVGTSELDLLDGQIHDLLSRLYKKAREAFNSQGDKTRASQYVFQELKQNTSTDKSRTLVLVNPDPQSS
jgi:hypothetical protein